MGAGPDQIEAGDVLAFVVRTEPRALQQYRFQSEGGAAERAEAVLEIERGHDAGRHDMPLADPAAPSPTDGAAIACR